MTIIEELRARSFPFRMLQSKLRDEQMHSGVGWGPLLEWYDTNMPDHDETVTWKDVFTEIYTNHLKYGTKGVVVFTIDRLTALALIKKIRSINYADSAFNVNYPLSLTTDELEVASFNPVPTFFEVEDSNVYRLVMCAKRAIKNRELFDFETLDPSVRSAFDSSGQDIQIDEIIVVSKRLIQSFDSVIINPDENRLEIHIDISNKISTDDLFRAIKVNVSKINELLESIPTIERLKDPINFFPYIKALYEEPDGYIHQLGHATGTASIKDEKMRGKGKDLRTELFHEEGLKAIGGFSDFYSITKGWDGDSLGSPQLTIAGRYAQAGSPEASITYAIIDGCNCKEDFEMVLSKLI